MPIRASSGGVFKDMATRRRDFFIPGAPGFPGGSAGKESACSVGHLSSILGWEDPLEKGKAPTAVFWPGEFLELCSAWTCRVGHD